MSTKGLAIFLVACTASARADDSDSLVVHRGANIELIREVLDDAAGRSSLFDSPLAGYDGRFFIASADGGFRAEFTAQMQFRYVLSVADDQPDDDVASGFENSFNGSRAWD